MNTLEHVSKNLNSILVNMMVRCMLNPDNKDFYLDNLSLEKVEHFFKTMPQDDEVADVFWSAYSIAEPQFIKQREQLAIENDYFGVVNEFEDTCPECGCRDYVSGVACPNCDYVDKD